MSLRYIWALLLPFTLYACAEEPKPEPKKDLKTEGGGYHGAVFRARERTTEKMDKVQETRSEQVKEEEEFDKKSPPENAE